MITIHPVLVPLLVVVGFVCGFVFYSWGLSRIGYGWRQAHCKRCGRLVSESPFTPVILDHPAHRGYAWCRHCVHTLSQLEPILKRLEEVDEEGA